MNTSDVKTNTITEVRAYNNYILMEKDEVQKETSGGIIIPDSAQKNNEWFKVISVGPSCSTGYYEGTEAKRLQPGDLVRKHSDIDVYIDGRTYKLVPDDNILCVRPQGSEKIKAFKQHVLVEGMQGQKVTESGLHIPESAQRPDWSRVVSVGSECKRGYHAQGHHTQDDEELPLLKAGDRVQYHKGLTIKLGERAYVAIPEPHVLMVFPSAGM